MGSACCAKNSTQTVPLLNLRPASQSPVTRMASKCRGTRSIFSCTEDSETSFHEISCNTKVLSPVRWKRGELLGEGAYAKVYQCLNLDTGELLATKHFMVRSRQFSEDPQKVRKEYESLKREISVLRDLEHPNVVKYIQADLSEEQDSIDVLMEYVPGGSIRRLVSQYKGLDEPVVSAFTRQLLHGLAYLHQNSVIHRDLKCANLLLDSSGQVKISDFGASKRLASAEVKLTRSMKGSPFWMAPEVVLKRGHNSAVDIWSLGCVVIEMVTGMPPWSKHSLDAKEILKMIAKPGSNGHTDLPDIPQGSRELAGFVRTCLQRSPEARPTAAQLLAHPFVSGAGSTQEWATPVKRKTDEQETSVIRESLRKCPYISH